jgi:hypothetical protein
MQPREAIRKIQPILSELLNSLEAVGGRNEEFFDTEVRQRVSDAIVDGFVREKPNYELPDEFGLYDDEANLAVRGALLQFIGSATAIAHRDGLASFHDRLASVQNRQVRSDGGYDYEEFLGHSPPEFFDANGKVVRTN